MSRFEQYTEKTSLVDNDLALIADSADLDAELQPRTKKIKLLTRLKSFFMLKPVSITNGNLVSMDASGNAVASTVNKLDIEGRFIGTSASPDFAYWFKIAEITLPSQFQIFNLRGSISVRAEGSTIPRVIDFYLGSEQLSGSTSFRTLALRIVAPFGVPVGLKLRATCDNTANIVKLYVGEKSISSAELGLFITYFHKPSTTSSIAYMNVNEGATPPTGDTVGGVDFVESSATENSIIPLSSVVGSMFPYAGATAPTGWLLCDGSAISRTTYATLFNLLNSLSPALPFGVGNGSTTFNIPDTREVALVGIGTRGAGVSADVYTLAQFKDDQMQGHYHGPASLGGSTSLIGQSGTDRYVPQGLQSTTEPITDGTNGTPRTGTTTRGKRLGVNYIIKF